MAEKRKKHYYFYNGKIVHTSEEPSKLRSPWSVVNLDVIGKVPQRKLVEAETLERDGVTYVREKGSHKRWAPSTGGKRVDLPLIKVTGKTTSGTGASGTTGTKTTGTRTTSPIWSKEDYKLSVIEALGENATRDLVSKLQEKLIAENLLAKAEDDGYGADGLWGQRTQRAWEKYKQKQSQTVPEVETPKLETPKLEIPLLPTSVAPDYYFTSNTYGNDTNFRNRINSLGLRSNADLINWMYKTGEQNYDWGTDNWAKQFRSDLNHVLEGDYSDENIRLKLNTQGRWYRGKSGDYSDLLKALSTGTTGTTITGTTGNTGTSSGWINKGLRDDIQNLKNNPYHIYTAKNGTKLVSRSIIERFKQK